MDKNNKSAFTLAEVLITLGVIGVVAAMTVPTLIKNYQKHVTINKLKSTYTILNNAIERTKSDYGTDVNSWEIPAGSEQERSNYFSENYLIPYLKVIKDCYNSNTGKCNSDFILLNGNKKVLKTNTRLFILANGTAINVHVSNTSRVQIWIYINGLNNKNKCGKDVFLVELGGSTATAGGNKNKFVPYGLYNSANTALVSRNKQLNSGDNNGCNVNAIGARCFALIMIDGWKISDDYPW